MKSRILKMALTWITPIVIGYIIKKVEGKTSKSATKA